MEPSITNYETPTQTLPIKGMRPPTITPLVKAKRLPKMTPPPIGNRTITKVAGKPSHLRFIYYPHGFY